jgi:dienelactone hydrolase
MSRIRLSRQEIPTSANPCYAWDLPKRMLGSSRSCCMGAAPRLKTSSDSHSNSPPETSPTLLRGLQIPHGIHIRSSPRYNKNEPWLGSALGVVAGLVEDLSRHGVPSARIAVMGFSQGACLTLEFVARRARRYAAVAAFTGGLIGPLGTARNYAGDLAGTPTFIGSSDVDPHVPLERVHESAAVLSRLGAQVDERIYPRMGHTINADEIQAADALLGIVK